MILNMSSKVLIQLFSDPNAIGFFIFEYFKSKTLKNIFLILTTKYSYSFYKNEGKPTDQWMTVYVMFWLRTGFTLMLSSQII